MSTSSRQSEGYMNCELEDDDSVPSTSRARKVGQIMRSEEDTEEEDDKVKFVEEKKKKGRGRPPTSGDYIKIAEKKQELMEIEKDELDLRLLQAAAGKILEGRAILDDRVSGTSDIPTADLIASINSSIDGINEVRRMSKGLKGTAVKLLKESAATIKASTEEMGMRIFVNRKERKSEEKSSSEEWELKLRKAEKRIEELTKEIEVLKTQRDTLTGEKPMGKRPERTCRRKPEWGLDLSNEESETNIETDRIRKKEDKEDGERVRDLKLTRNIMDSFKDILKNEMDSLREELEDKFLPREKQVYIPGEDPLGTQMETDEDPYPELNPHTGVIREVPRKRIEIEKIHVKEREKGMGKGKPKPRITSNIRIKEPTNKEGNSKFERIGKSLLKIQEETLETNKEKERKEERMETWTDVVKRKGGSKTPKIKKKTGNVMPRKIDTKAIPKRKIRKLPKTEAITIVCPEGCYEEVMSEATSKIDLKELGILDGVQQRTTRTGAISIRIAGEGSKEKADALSVSLKSALACWEGVKIARPVIRSEILITGLDHSVKAETIAAAVAKEGECRIEEVSVNPTKINPKTRRGTAWVRCPAKAANRIVANGGMLAGWARVGARHLEQRPLRCYRCLEEGHVRAECTSKVDRSGWCYRCGENNHQIRDCKGVPRCPICAERGAPSNHRVGAKGCNLVVNKKKNNQDRKKTEDNKRDPKSAKDCLLRADKEDMQKNGNIYDLLNRDDHMDTETSTHGDAREEVTRDNKSVPETELASSTSIMIMDPEEEEEERMETEVMKMTRPAPPSSLGEGGSPIRKKTKPIKRSDDEEEETNVPEETAKYKGKDEQQNPASQHQQ